jgi:predicted nucleic acid-binding protein
MAANVPQRLRFALDTNVLIDLGEGKPFAQRFLATHRHSGLAVTPTAVQELVHLAGSNHPAQPHAESALFNLRRWNILPIDLMPTGHGIAELNAKKLTAAGILPEDEFNDGLIVVETALAGVPSLITSDKHLLMINPAQLIQKLDEFHLPPVAIYHPKHFLR